MHVFRLFNGLVVGEHVEIIITPLPELGLRGGFESARCGLLQDLKDDCERRFPRLAGEQVNVFGHEDISGDDEAVTLANGLQFALEGGVGLLDVQERESSITTEGNEVKLTGLLVTGQVSGHGERSLWHEAGLGVTPPSIRLTEEGPKDNDGLALVVSHPPKRGGDEAPSLVVGIERARVRHPPNR